MAAEYGPREQFLDEFNIDIFVGFVPWPNQLGRKVDVTELSYESVKKPMTFDTVAKVSLAATARTEAQTYERAYNVKQEKAGGSPPSNEDDTRIVNSLVSMALEDMLTDKQLLALLAK